MNCFIVRGGELIKKYIAWLLVSCILCLLGDPVLDHHEEVLNPNYDNVIGKKK